LSASESDNLVDRIDALLPQTQCTQCGYDGCRPYAEAIARGEADINRCPPGGDEGLRALAALLERPAIPIAPECGEPLERPQVALIDESICIGCTRCIQACPTDAIVGAARQMHTVIAAECTGCGLCLAPCPVDCIELEPDPDPTPPRAYRDYYKARFAARNARQAERARERERRRAAKQARLNGTGDRSAKRQEIDAAVARARARKRRQRGRPSGESPQ